MTIRTDRADFASAFDEPPPAKRKPVKKSAMPAEKKPASRKPRKVTGK